PVIIVDQAVPVGVADRPAEHVNAVLWEKMVCYVCGSRVEIAGPAGATDVNGPTGPTLGSDPRRGSEILKVDVTSPGGRSRQTQNETAYQRRSRIMHDTSFRRAGLSAKQFSSWSGNILADAPGCCQIDARTHLVRDVDESVVGIVALTWGRAQSRLVHRAESFPWRLRRNHAC